MPEQHPHVAFVEAAPLHKSLGLVGPVRSSDGRSAFEADVGELVVNAVGRAHAAFFYTFLDVAS